MRIKKWILSSCAIAVAVSVSDAQVSYYFIQAETGNTLAKATFDSQTASATSPWELNGNGSALIALVMDYTALGGPTFDFGSNIDASGDEGFITSISINSLTSDGPTLDGGSAGARFFFRTLDGQLNDPRFQIQASISGSSVAGQDRFGLSYGGQGDFIDAQWVDEYYFGDWVVVPTPGSAALLGLSGMVFVARRRR